MHPARIPSFLGISARHSFFSQFEDTFATALIDSELSQSKCFRRSCILLILWSSDLPRALSTNVTRSTRRPSTNCTSYRCEVPGVRQVETLRPLLFIRAVPYVIRANAYERSVYLIREPGLYESDESQNALQIHQYGQGDGASAKLRVCKRNEMIFTYTPIQIGTQRELTSSGFTMISQRSPRGRD